MNGIREALNLPFNRGPWPPKNVTWSSREGEGGLAHTTSDREPLIKTNMNKQKYMKDNEDERTIHL